VEELHLSPVVSFYENKSFQNLDIRRYISGVDGDFGLPMQIRQIKLIQFNEESIKKKLVVGNHKHYGESGQWELVIILGEKDVKQFDFRYRNYNENVQERILYGGDVAVIPPGCSLGLVALHANAMLIEISNKVYNPSNYIEDILF
jgi:dTDP-4-dehydrorhamnose 3,5-epimerase-like enzyme